uniref:protein NLP3-like n=1 Tax=Erigeron canadensis TaxID=72917 RepID=UPI001CB9A4E2|nr:protein NLP3-like [Erigeron canadensis]
MDGDDVKSSDVGGGGGGGSAMGRIADKMRNNLCLEPPTRPFSGESRYLTSLWVAECGGEPPDEPASPSVDSSLSSISSLERRANSDQQKLQDKIKSALKRLAFREQRVLVQFWYPQAVGKHRLLTTMDQPFGLGVKDDQGLLLYRKHSERNPFLVDKDHQEEDRSPLARVFRRGLPEWTSDLLNYNPRQFPLQDCAISCNLHGYLALPVFDFATRLCVGVLELLMSSNYTSVAYEVQHFHRVLKNLDLRTPQAFDYPTFNVHNQHKQNELENILSILKDVCYIHKLPFGQTWVLSPMNSFVSHDKVLMKSCNSFDTTCRGKVCMSTVALPFHIQDLGTWPFWKACRKQHLDKSQGVVGRALSYRGTSFCGDVTKLSEEVYPLVHNARMTGLTCCFATYLHNVVGNNEYVLEFFLPLDMRDGILLPNVVQTLKQKVEVTSTFELGDTSSIQVVGAREGSSLSLDIDPPIFSTATTNSRILEMVSSDSESMAANVTNTKSANSPNQWSPKQKYPNKFGAIITNSKNLVRDEVVKDNVDVLGASKNSKFTYPPVSMKKSSEAITDAVEKNNRLKQGRKRKITLTMESVGERTGKTIDQAAKSLEVSESSQGHDMPRRPFPKYNKIDDHGTSSTTLQKSWSRPSKVRFSISVLVFLLVRVKRWSCSRKRHGFSGKWWSCGKHRHLPCKSDSIYQAACLMMQLKRWRNKTIGHVIKNRDHPDVYGSTLEPEYTTQIVNTYLHGETSLAHASPKKTNISDSRMVTVKATFRDDMIKFQFWTSSSLLELENEVARRFKFKSRMFRLKYKDEDNDLILLACDADLHTLLGYSASNSTIKLIVLTND